MLHYVKLCADNISVCAIKQWLGHREINGMQGFLYNILSIHLFTHMNIKHNNRIVKNIISIYPLHEKY